MKHELRLFLIALQFFTRVPVPAWVGFQPEWLNQSARYFPLVGACVGAAGASVLWAASLVFPPVVAVGLSMVATMLITGGFHEDGLADTFDALGGAVSRERALEIMKDSRIGSYGALALVMVLGLKAAALVALMSISISTSMSSSLSLSLLTSLTSWSLWSLWAALPWHISMPALPLALPVLLFAHTASRAAAATLIFALPYAGDVAHAKAKPLAQRISPAGLVVAWVSTLTVGALAALCFGLPLAWWLGSVAAAVLGCLGCGAWLHRRLGGTTGDGLGATQQITELLMLLAALAWARFA